VRFSPRDARPPSAARLHRCPPRHRGGHPRVHHDTVGDNGAELHERGRTLPVHHEAVGDNPVSTTTPWGTTPCPPRHRGGLRCGAARTGAHAACPPRHRGGQPRVHHDTVGDITYPTERWPPRWPQVPSRYAGPAEPVHCDLRGDPATLVNQMFLSRTGTRARGRRRNRGSTRAEGRCVLCDPSEARCSSWRCHVTARAVTSPRCSSWRCHVTARAVTLTCGAALRRLRSLKPQLSSQKIALCHTTDRHTMPASLWARHVATQLSPGSSSKQTKP